MQKGKFHFSAAIKANAIVFITACASGATVALASATALSTEPAGVSAYYAKIGGAWSYDAFGNRTAEGWTGNWNTTAITPNSISASFASANNQVTAYDQIPGNGPLVCDPAGNVIQDNLNSYIYDAEGRLCAVDTTQNPAVPNQGYTGYVYDAAGTRNGHSMSSWPAYLSWRFRPGTSFGAHPLRSRDDTCWPVQQPL